MAACFWNNGACVPLRVCLLLLLRLCTNRVTRWQLQVMRDLEGLRVRCY